MPREDRATWKSNYFLKIIQLLDDYPKCFIVGADNVGSKQMQQIRMSLRGKAVVLMGKNTMMRKAIRGHLENNPALEGVRNVASVCLQIGYPTVASVPHSIINGYKRVLALSVETDYTFPLAEKVKAFLADPSAFVAAAPVAAATTAAPAAAAAPAKVEAKEESEESDEDMGFGLFD
ncbi:ribosomal protein lateral stalk subunit P0 [Rhinolophus ferrumequinum]|uniref:Large ribosomal subunit protein uL10 n=1 Tax=Rhinolophus ferrumequinum TaxID=59479 RepID=A0A7J7RQM4_RHIFE|nr:ribosomal protein lateral stalk subunit P0 [Rhinolophus ferrumequinum]